MKKQEKKPFRWTKAEDRTLLYHINKSPNNLNKAFKTTARLVGRSEKATAQHWYQVLSKKEPAFLLLSKANTTINRKTRGTQIPNKGRSFWYKLLRWLNIK